MRNLITKTQGDEQNWAFFHAQSYRFVNQNTTPCTMLPGKPISSANEDLRPLTHLRSSTTTPPMQPTVFPLCCPLTAQACLPLAAHLALVLGAPLRTLFASGRFRCCVGIQLSSYTLEPEVAAVAAVSCWLLVREGPGTRRCFCLS